MKCKLKNLFWYIFLILFMELIYKIFILKSVFTFDSLYVFVFSLPFVFLLYLISNLFNEKVNRILVIIFSLAITILFEAQIVYYNFYQSMFSFFSLLNGTGQVMEFAEDILKIMLGIWYVILIGFIPFILFLIFGKKIFSFKRIKFKKATLIIILLLILWGVCFITIKRDKKGAYSLNRLFFETHAPIMTVKKFGLMTTTVIDLERYLFGFEEKIIEFEKEEVIVEKPVEYNKLDIDFETLIANESNNTIKNMHEYFSSQMATEKNNYTGMFKGKNLIFITAEGFDTLAIDDMLTPTLYKLSTNGFIFTNYYQPLFPVSTSDGEYMNMTSLVPKEGVWSAYRSSKISMPFAIANMFKKLGYKTNAYHNHSYKYYDRHLSHPNMGFNYMGCGNGLEKRMDCDIWPESDDEMMRVTVDDYIYTKVVKKETTKTTTKTTTKSSSKVREIKEASSTTEEIDKAVEEMVASQNFATYYMTVSGHLNYSKMGNNMSRRNWDSVSSLPYSDSVKAYIACQMEFDKALKYLLERLEEANILDDTLIVIGPDHYPYGLKNERSEMSKILGYDRTDKFENYRTTLIMYNSKMEPVIVDKYVSSIDILPTVYNLFGLDFDSRLFMGRDALSDEEGLVMLSDRSFITDKGKYNSISGKFTKFNSNEELDEEYVDKMINKVNQKFSMSALILDNNYYSRLGLE